MPKGRRDTRLLVAIGAVCLATVMGWGVIRAADPTEESVGRYQAAAPDLILDTATGRLTNAAGQLLEQPIDPSSAEVGRYSAAGFVTAVTRSVGLDVLNRPTAEVELVKGYVIADTKTGRVLRQRIYHSRPLEPGQL